MASSKIVDLHECKFQVTHKKVCYVVLDCTYLRSFLEKFCDKKRKIVNNS